jgi:hypothetical protein
MRSAKVDRLLPEAATGYNLTPTMHPQRTSQSRVSAVRSDVSGVGLTAIVAALYLVILAARVSGRHQYGCRPLLSWEAPASPDTASAREEEPSNPHRNYSVGELALTVGMAVVSLARWLHVTRINGSRAC